MSWSLGAAVECVCGSDANPKIGDFGDCGEAFSCASRDMDESVRSRVGVTGEVVGE